MEKISLARFVQETRENIGLSIKGLAKKSNVDFSLIEKIEAGEELFLAATVRQNLAKALKCEPREIKALEKDFENKFMPNEIIESLKEKILQGENNLTCPDCGSKLITRIAKLYDLEDNLMLHPKARCSKCVFQIKS